MTHPLAAGLIGMILAVLIGAAVAGEGPAHRRLALIEAVRDGSPRRLALLDAALADENLVVRRTAARLLGDLGEEARGSLLKAFRDADAVVRQAALKGLLALAPGEGHAILGQALGDTDLAVRLVAVNALAAMAPRGPEVEQLLDRAAGDSADAVRTVASRALWPFHRQVTPLRERADWDHDVEVVLNIPLPAADWRFATDPKTEGHRLGWHEEGFDDSAWPPIAIEQTWEKAGHPYDGVAWYRRWIELPPEPQGTIHAVELAFGGVDECTWVWLNGAYVGDHDLGPSGWNRPFSLDVTGLVRWGARNQLTVRVHDSAHAGGIWQPVRLEVLR